ncbi:MAG TPA: DDE-type integrase/transposase/recombinase [Candidatus Nanoarchaeia archaeon]|nr:DDE-type integrase/transposase/recombinase [Candidatus Nanoarchaeia archaeon]
MATNQISPNIDKQLGYKNPSEQMRIVRGYAIISKGDTPKQIDAKTFTIPSQHGNGEYNVTIGRKATCTCPDFKDRRKDCKHIHAVKFYLDFNQKVKTENKGIVTERQACPYCQSTDTIGYGKRHTKQGQKQRYQCTQCHKGFIEEKDFERYKGNGKVTTVILDLYFKGISLRGIQDHLKQFYMLSLDPSNILRRIQKYSTIINDYTKTLKPEVANIWNHDEMKIQAGGKWKWLWNIMDEQTKYLITTKVSTKLTTRVTKQFMTQARDQAQKQPVFLLTDGRHPLTKSIEKVMPETYHIRLAKLTDKRQNNQNIERLNGTIRDRIKTMRGFQNAETAEAMTSAYRNYYNFIKPHTTLNGSTPALKAGIGITLEGNKWKTLLKKSLK